MYQYYGVMKMKNKMISINDKHYGMRFAERLVCDSKNSNMRTMEDRRKHSIEYLLLEGLQNEISQEIDSDAIASCSDNKCNSYNKKSAKIKKAVNNIITMSRRVRQNNNKQLNIKKSINDGTYVPTPIGEIDAEELL